MKNVLLLFGVAGCFCAGDIEQGSAKQASSKELNSVEYIAGVYTKIDNNEIKDITDLGVENASKEDQEMILGKVHSYLQREGQQRKLTPAVFALAEAVDKAYKPTRNKGLIFVSSYRVTEFMIFIGGALCVIALLRMFPISVRVIN